MALKVEGSSNSATLRVSADRADCPIGAVPSLADVAGTFVLDVPCGMSESSRVVCVLARFASGDGCVLAGCALRVDRCAGESGFGVFFDGLLFLLVPFLSFVFFAGMHSYSKFVQLLHGCPSSSRSQDVPYISEHGPKITYVSESLVGW